MEEINQIKPPQNLMIKLSTHSHTTEMIRNYFQAPGLFFYFFFPQEKAVYSTNLVHYPIIIMQFLKWWKPYLKWFVDAAVFETVAAVQGCWVGLGTAGWNGNQLAQEKPTYRKMDHAIRDYVIMNMHRGDKINLCAMAWTWGTWVPEV